MYCRYRTESVYEVNEVALQKQRHMTVAEFENFISRSENSDRLFELINGEIVEKMPTQLHAVIANFFNALLYLYKQKNPVIWVFSEVRVKLPGDKKNDRIPDLAVALKEGREFDPYAPLAYMPDLIIEIQSPSQSDKFMVDKAAYYLAKGTRMVWIIYPEKRLLEVLTKTDRKLLTELHILDGGDVLPDFTLPVKNIFEQV
jgi:Uma2 family endonuclease